MHGPDERDPSEHEEDEDGPPKRAEEEEVERGTRTRRKRDNEGSQKDRRNVTAHTGGCHMNESILTRHVAVKWTSVVWHLSHLSRITDTKTAESGSGTANSSICEASVSSWARSGVGCGGAFSDLIGGGAESGG